MPQKLTLRSPADDQTRFTLCLTFARTPRPPPRIILYPPVFPRANNGIHTQVDVSHFAKVVVVLSPRWSFGGGGGGGGGGGPFTAGLTKHAV